MLTTADLNVLRKSYVLTIRDGWTGTETVRVFTRKRDAVQVARRVRHASVDVTEFHYCRPVAWVSI